MRVVMEGRNPGRCEWCWRACYGQQHPGGRCAWCWRDESKDGHNPTRPTRPIRDSTDTILPVRRLIRDSTDNPAEYWKPQLPLVLQQKSFMGPVHALRVRVDRLRIIWRSDSHQSNFVATSMNLHGSVP